MADGDNAVLRIELSGVNIPAANGLNITGGGSTVQGMVINRFAIGIYVSGSGDNHILGNFVGTDASGTQVFQSLPPGYGQGAPFGVELTGAGGNWVGTTEYGTAADDLAQRNIISGWNAGVVLWGSGDPTVLRGNNVVAGNFIGTDSTGTKALGNWAGIAILQCSTNDHIGVYNLQANGLLPNGRSPADERNVISGNIFGIVLGAGNPAPAAVNTQIYGNDIGTDVSGTLPLGNQWGGLALAIGSEGCSIGSDTAPALGNIIAFNGGEYPNTLNGPGVWMVSFRASPYNNSVQGNSIYGNAGLGIDLGGAYPTPGPDGVTFNDSEGHTGPNNFQDFRPELGHYLGRQYDHQRVAAEHGRCTLHDRLLR
jgi:titin